MRIVDEFYERFNKQMLVVGSQIVFDLPVLFLQIDDQLILDIIAVLRLLLIICTKATKN